MTEQQKKEIEKIWEGWNVIFRDYGKHSCLEITKDYQYVFFNFDSKTVGESFNVLTLTVLAKINQTLKVLGWVEC